MMYKFLTSFLLFFFLTVQLTSAQDVAIGNFRSGKITYKVFISFPTKSSLGFASVRYISKGKDKLMTQSLQMSSLTVSGKKYIYLKGSSARMIEGKASYTADNFLFDRGAITSSPIIIPQKKVTKNALITDYTKSGNRLWSWKTYSYSELTKKMIKPFFPNLSHPIYKSFLDKKKIANDPYSFVKTEFVLSGKTYQGFIFLDNITKSGVARLILKYFDSDDVGLFSFDIQGYYITKQGNQYLALYGYGDVLNIGTTLWSIANSKKRPQISFYKYFKPNVFIFPIDDIKTKPFYIAIDKLNNSKTVQELVSNGISLKKWEFIDRSALSQDSKSPQNKPSRFFPYLDDAFNTIFLDKPYSKINKKIIKIILPEVKYIISDFTYPYKIAYLVKRNTHLTISSLTASGNNVVITMEKLKSYTNSILTKENLYLTGGSNSSLRGLMNQGYKINNIVKTDNKTSLIFYNKNSKRSLQRTVYSKSNFTEGKYKETLQKQLKAGFVVIAIAPVYVPKVGGIRLTAITEKDILGIGNQEVLFGLDKFPIAEITKYKNQNYNITTALYSNEKWYVVMTQAMQLSNQQYKIAKKYPFSWVKKNMKNGLNITTSTWGADGWLVVMSRGRLINN